MKTTTGTFRSQFFFPGSTNLTKPTSKSPFLIHIQAGPPPLKKQQPTTAATIPRRTTTPLHVESKRVNKSPCQREFLHQGSADGHNSSRFLVAGAVSIGVVLLMMGLDDHKALALGPEGPLVEEFWDNVRRYALYALTVSTGALYTLLLPILELLKNPISAVLLLIVFGGSVYIISQVVSAMVGISDFSYDYAY
ncbi:hypothetical protein Tsubulata_020656 [Turnera subulata]|uniref:Uncharacterized protein ycf33 n=1 Tax=Turnera subulata TaxID=218843 RepID=A0A9Q0GD67_9ROSI|nr:hypothetical protein Tsubulata_020656 [Turnera subulata]